MGIRSHFAPRESVHKPSALALSLGMAVGCGSARDFDCGTLANVREIPFKGEAVDDAAYNAITERDQTLLEGSLVECIDDTTPMPDPRKAPPYPAFVVGDAAVIILADSTGIPIEDLLPEEFQASWPDLGIYSYFKYVSVDSNRQRLKSAWRRRLSQR